MSGKLLMLNKKEFTFFYNLLDNMAHFCSDLYIKNGIISQPDSKRSFVFFIDAVSLFDNSDIILSNISIKKNLLNPFKKSKSGVSVRVDDNNVIFEDGFSSIPFSGYESSIPENLFLDIKKVKEYFGIFDENSIFRGLLSGDILKRFVTYAKTLGSVAVFVSNISGKVEMSMYGLDSKSSNKVGVISFDNNVPFSFDVSFPFSLFHSSYLFFKNLNEVNFVLYKKKEEEKEYISIDLYSDIYVSENKKVSVNLYSCTKIETK